MENLFVCKAGVVTRCANPPEMFSTLKLMTDPEVAALGYRRQAVKGDAQAGLSIEVFQLTSSLNMGKHSLPPFVVVVKGTFSVMANVIAWDFPALLDLLNQKLVFLR
jgi:hypothetical protein